MMNVVFATDDNFVQHCGTAIKSVAVNNSNVHFYILTEGLIPRNEDLLRSVVTGNGNSLDFCLVPSDIVKYFPMSKMASSHISIATYYRLFVTTLLPETVDKIVYLDCDMIIRGSLDGLWNTDVTEAPLAAVYQHNAWADHNNSWARLNIPREYGYFNAGCLLLNLKYLREINFQQTAVEFIISHFDSIISHDQDVLNALFCKKALALDCKWNYLPLFIGKTFDKAEFPEKCHYKEECAMSGFEPVIIHFVFKPKPWNYGCNNPYKNEYFKYLAMTPWMNYKVKFSLNDYLKYNIVPAIKGFIISVDYFNIIEKLKK